MAIGPLFEPLDEPDDDQEAVAANIRALMGRHRVSQQRLASAIGLSSRGMSERLSGKTNFTVRELGRIARFFGKSLGDLVTPILLGLYVTRIEDPPVTSTSHEVQLTLFGYDTRTPHVAADLGLDAAGPAVVEQEAA